MIILALDTSTTAATVALSKDMVLLGEYTLICGKQHSIKLVPTIQTLLKDSGLKPSEVDIFAVGSGPGSFTGLRIGIVTVKALARALDKRIAVVPSLDILADNVPFFEGIICPMTDARNNQVYTAYYKWKEVKPERFTEYEGKEIISVIEEINLTGEKVVFCGDGALKHEKLIKEVLKDKAYIASMGQNIIRASSLCRLAYHKALEGNYARYDELTPFYLRKSQAERYYDIRNK